MYKVWEEGKAGGTGAPEFRWEEVGITPYIDT